MGQSAARDPGTSSTSAAAKTNTSFTGYWGTDGEGRQKDAIHFFKPDRPLSLATFFPFCGNMHLKMFEQLHMCLCIVKQYFRGTYPAQSPAALCDVC